jgi:hypothetical protein
MSDCFLDLERYPILDLDSPAGRALVASCREQLRQTGACRLPGFVDPASVERMAAEGATLVPEAHLCRGHATAYLEIPDMSLPSEHARRLFGPSSSQVIAYDQVPATHALRQLYEWDPLMTFLARVLDVPRLYRYADPLGALNVVAMGDGEELWWHFDQVDFVTSLALQSSEAGGEFSYAPRIRSSEDENYDAVRAVLAGEVEIDRTIAMEPGTMLLFQGRHSLHRVKPIRGRRDRLVALLAYDTKPGTDSTELLKLGRYGRTTARA